MPENPSEHKERPHIKISKVHFLIHPGFHGDVLGQHMFPKLLKPTKESPEGLKQEQESAYQDAMTKYTTAAKNMTDNEIMIAFLHKTKGELKSSLQKHDSYSGIIHKLKEILGDRLIVFSEEFNIATINPWTRTEPIKIAFDTAIRLAKARGYELTPDVESKAFGEYLSACVKTAQKNINDSKILNKNTGLSKDKSIESE